MSIKTYTWVKYLATLGSIILLIDPLLVFLKVMKENFFIQTWTGLIQTTIPLFCLGVIFFGIYFWLRIILIKKSGYTYTKKDQLYLTLSLTLYSMAILMTGLSLLVGLMVQDTNNTLAITFFAVSYTLVIGGMISGAICESLSRIQEQVKLYQDQNQAFNQAKKAKRQQLLQSEISEEEIEKEVKAKRTKEAEQLLNRKQTKKAKTQVVGGNQKEVKVKKTSSSGEYNPFLDEKLNQELKNDSQFQKWLNPEKAKDHEKVDETKN